MNFESRMNPYSLINILLTCLIACKVVVSVFNRTELTPTDFVVLLIAAGVFHMGMVPIAEFLIGQKTITMWSFYDGIKIRRENTCYVIWTLTLSVFFACGGAAVIMTIGS